MFRQGSDRDGPLDVRIDHVGHLFQGLLIPADYSCCASKSQIELLLHFPLHGVELGNGLFEHAHGVVADEGILLGDFLLHSLDLIPCLKVKLLQFRELVDKGLALFLVPDSL